MSPDDTAGIAVAESVEAPGQPPPSEEAAPEVSPVEGEPGAAEAPEAEPAVGEPSEAEVAVAEEVKASFSEEDKALFVEAYGDDWMATPKGKELVERRAQSLA